MTRAFVALIGVVLLGAAAPQAPSGCAGPEHRQFDFWLGDWTVTDSAGGVPYGANLVTSEESGCLVHEHWRGVRGATGQSFNFFDRQRGQWEQVWVASSGNVLHLAGRLDGGRMVLEGDGLSPAGAAIRNRIVWTPEGDGRVRQEWSTSADGGRSWVGGFDGWYRRKTGG